MVYSRLAGLGHSVPKRIVENADLEKIVDTSDEWIQSRTGIKRRRISEGETTIDLATGAAKKALEDAGVSPEEVDLIIVATMTPDNFMPSTACSVQGNIGANKAIAFDITAACSGFVYGLSIADNFIKCGMAEKALVIGAEILSKAIDWNDRSTCVIFADGAGAALLVKDDKPGIIKTTLGAKGDLEGALQTPGIALNNFLVKNPPANSYIKMEGQSVFRFSTKIIGDSIKETLEGTGYGVSDLDWIVPHQANYRIIDFAAAKLKVDREKFYLNLSEYGNTSAASVPIALSDMKEKGLLKEGNLIMLTAFGGGLTWGSALLKL